MNCANVETPKIFLSAAPIPGKVIDLCHNMFDVVTCEASIKHLRST